MSATYVVKSSSVHPPPLYILVPTPNYGRIGTYALTYTGLYKQSGTHFSVVWRPNYGTYGHIYKQIGLPRIRGLLSGPEHQSSTSILTLAHPHAVRRCTTLPPSLLHTVDDTTSVDSHNFLFPLVSLIQLYTEFSVQSCPAQSRNNHHIL